MSESAGHLVPIDDLRRCVADAGERLGMPPSEAEQVAEVLLDCELRGHESHGVHMVGWIADNIRLRHHNPRPNVRVLRETDTARLLDGDGGHVVGALRAMRWCSERARERHGIALAVVQNTQWIVPCSFAR